MPLELSSTSLLATEIKALARSLLEKKVTIDNLTLEVLVRGILLLQDHLKCLAADKKDHSFNDLPLINKIRAAQCKTLLAPVDLFTPDLAVPLPDTLITQTDASHEDLRSLATRLRPHYEVALLQWFRDPASAGLLHLIKIVAELREHSHELNVLRLWWLSQGIFESLQEGGLQPTQEIKLLIGGMGRQIKLLAQEGETALAANITDVLLKSLLLEIAGTTSSGTQVTAIKETYHLEHYLPSDRILPTKLSIDVIEALLAAFREDFTQARIFLNNAERVRGQQPEMESLHDLLQKMVDTLEVLGLVTPIPMLHERISQLEELRHKGVNFNEEQYIEFACALLQAEALLEQEAALPQSSFQNRPILNPLPDTPSETFPILTQRSDFRAAQRAVVIECLDELALAGQAITSYSKDSATLGVLNPLPEKLQQIADALSLAGLSRIADLLMDCRRCIYKAFIKKGDTSLNTLESLAEVISSIELYLEGLAEEGLAHQFLLSIATDRLAARLEAMNHIPEDQTAASENIDAASGMQSLARETESIYHSDPEISLNVAELPDLGNPGTLFSPEGINTENELTTVFLEEADELLKTSQESLSAWQNAPTERQFVERLQRGLHTLKGGARLARIAPMADLTHQMEAVISAAADVKCNTEPALFNLLQRCLDRLCLLRDQAQEAAPFSTVTDLLAETNRYNSVCASDLNQESASMQAPLPAPEAHEVAQIAAESRMTSIEQVRVRADLLDQLIQNSTEANTFCTQIKQQFQALHLELSTMGRVIANLEEKNNNHLDSNAMDRDRCSQPQPLPRNSIEGISNLIHIQENMDKKAREVNTLLLQQSHIGVKLQQSLMHARILPFNGVAPRLHRIVRQTAQELNKKIKLDLADGGIELDCTILNRITAPLDHLLRNSIVHGIEMPSDRIQSGKEEAGLIHLSLIREDSKIIIQVSDDGCGIDLEKVRAKALAQGLVQEDTMPPDDTLIQLILKPNFSTADEVSQIAGRGVGLDVVNSEIRELNGSLHIVSQKGAGTTFTIHLPDLPRRSS